MTHARTAPSHVASPPSHSSGEVSGLARLRTHEEMLAIGAELVGRFSRHKFVSIQRRRSRRAEAIS